MKNKSLEPIEEKMKKPSAPSVDIEEDDDDAAREARRRLRKPLVEPRFSHRDLD